MALVFVAKDMQVATPVGNVNIHPLPDLPSGIQYAHLLRHSLDAMRINLVNGELLNAQELHRSSTEGNLVYDRDSIFSDFSSSGWFFPEWDFPFDVGLTWMAVTLAPTENVRSAHRMISSGDYATADRGLLNMSLRPLDGSGRIRIGGSDYFYSSNSYTTPSAINGYPSDPFMVFGTADGGAGTRSLYTPHDSAGLFDDSFTLDGPAPQITGVTLAASTGLVVEDADTRLYMVAQWGRALSQLEMDAAYRALKPWLLARGVNIA